MERIQSSASLVSSPLLDRSRRCLLLIESDARRTEHLTQIIQAFRRIDAEVVCDEGLAAALETLRRRTFDAVLLDDALLPGSLPAVPLAEQLAELREAAGQAALIVLSDSDSDADDLSRSASRGIADDCLLRFELNAGLLERSLCHAWERREHEATTVALQSTFEQRVAERTRTLSLLHEVAVAANSILDVEQAFGRVLELVCQRMSWAYGRVHVAAHHDGSLIPSGIEYAGDQRLMARLQRGEVCRNVLAREASWLKHAFHDGQANFVKNMLFHPRELVRQFALDMQFNGAAALPVVVGDEVVAVMEFFADDEIQRGPRIQETLTHVGIQLGRVVERKRAECSLRETEERFRMLIESVEDYAIFLLDTDGHVVSWNAGARRIKGYESCEVLGRHVSQFYIPADRVAGLPDRHLKLAGELGRWAAVTEQVRSGGERYWADSVLTALRDEAGELRGFAKVTRDVTHRKELEKEIADRTSAEQQRIGLDLHDGLGQQLTGLAYQAERLRRKLRRDCSELEEPATNLLQGIQEAIGQVRLLTKGLLPVEVDAHGLSSALEELAEHTEEVHEVRCRFHCEKPVPVENNQTATHLFRIAQESVTNALRHGHPRLIEIDLSADEDEIRLTIRDNGRGFRSSADSDGNGFRIMRHRAGLIRAELEVTSQPQRGTLVHCNLPRRPDETG